MPSNEVKDLVRAKSKYYGKVVYLLGTAEYGPTNQPVRVTSVAHMYSIFGKKGTLIKAFEELRAVSTSAIIYLCKITGSHSIAKFHINLQMQGVEENAITVKSIHSHEDFNNISIMWGDKKLVIKSTSGINYYKEYLYEEFKTLDLLISKINDDAKTGKGLIEINCSIDSCIYLKGSISSVNPSEVFLCGGETGLEVSKNDLYESLMFAYDLLEGVDCDIIIPVEMFIDDIQESPKFYGEDEYGLSEYRDKRDYLDLVDKDNNKCSFYNITTKFCAKQGASGLTTIAVMGYNTLPDELISDVSEDFVNRHIVTPFRTNFLEKELEEYRFLVQIVACDLFNKRTAARGNGYIHYAGTVVNVGFSCTPINKVVADHIALFSEYDNSQILELSENGIVCFRHSVMFDKVVVCSAVTSSIVENHFRYIHNVRMIQFAVTTVKEVANMFIGESLSYLLKRGKLENELNSALFTLKTVGVPISFDLDVERVGLHNIKININLKTDYMSEFINSSFKIKPKGGVDYAK